MGRKKRKKDWANVSKPPELKERLKGVSLGKDDKGYFVYTHRCRSDSYESPEKIPKAKIRFIESTGSKEFPLSIRAAEEKKMPFPGRYRKALKKRTKTLTIRVHDEQDKYEVGEIYEASTYGGEPWGIKVKVLDIDTVPRKDVRAGYKDLEDLEPDDPVDVIRIEVMKPEKKKKEAALVVEAQDPIRQTADSMLKIIVFLLFRVPPQSKRRFLQRVRGKIQKLSPADISMKSMPPTASIGQAIGITKNILAGLNPFFIKRVLDELTRMLHAIPADHHLPAAPPGIHPELQPKPRKGKGPLKPPGPGP